ncbi:MAG: hypothetical protein S4CHLAM81_10210 [Chlamydiales bacterium]|nr:hypothetical protein [Chlamydiales bacterium]MCH9635799.1 hypothetical protein [Chlamydiales bacterium]MCH9703195.1 hypothetical protein [Chlamydiota bacterium]
MAAALNTQGVSFKLDGSNKRQMRSVRNLAFISGIILAIGITLCSLHANKTINIPCSIRNYVLAPTNTILSSLFVMAVLGYVVASSTAKEEPSSSAENWKGFSQVGEAEDKVVAE